MHIITHLELRTGVNGGKVGIKQTMNEWQSGGDRWRGGVLSESPEERSLFAAHPSTARHYIYPLSSPPLCCPSFICHKRNRKKMTAMAFSWHKINIPPSSINSFHGASQTKQLERSRRAPVCSNVFRRAHGKTCVRGFC